MQYLQSVLRKIFIFLLFSTTTFAETRTYRFTGAVENVNVGNSLHSVIGATVGGNVKGIFSYNFSTNLPTNVYFKVNGVMVTITGTRLSKYTDFTIGTWVGHIAPNGTTDLMVDFNYRRSEVRIRNNVATTGLNWNSAAKYMTATVSNFMSTTRNNPWDFIPTFTLLYNPSGCPISEANIQARKLYKWDIIDTQYDSLTSCMSINGETSGRSLKRYNPEQLMFYYENGPALLTKDSGGGTKLSNLTTAQFKALYGIGGSIEQWTIGGLYHGSNYITGSLTNGGYNDDLYMDLRINNWLQKWIDYASDPRIAYPSAGINLDGVDGIFADNMQTPALPAYVEAYANPDTPYPCTAAFVLGCDMPNYGDTPFNFTTLRTKLLDAIDFITPKLTILGLKWIPNMFAMQIEQEPFGPSGILASEARTYQPFAGMVEGAVSVIDGHSTVTDIAGSVNTVSALVSSLAATVKNKIIFHNSWPGCANLDDTPVAGGSYTTCKGMLWYSIGVFLLGYNDNIGNAYFGWDTDYNNGYWRDEFDPTYLHLGRSIGTYSKVNTMYFREFTDGYIAVNSDQNAHTFTFPNGGSFRVCTYDNFKNADKQCGASLVSSYAIPRNEAVILLKNGKHIGDDDNTVYQ